MGQGEMRLMHAGDRILQQVFAEAGEVRMSIDAWQEDAVPVEALWWTKGEFQRRRRPSVDPLAKHFIIQVPDFILAAQGDMGSDEAGLDGVEPAAMGLEQPGGRRRDEKSELGSCVHDPGD